MAIACVGPTFTEPLFGLLVLLIDSLASILSSLLLAVMSECLDQATKERWLL